MYLEARWMTGLAIVVLASAMLLRFLPGGVESEEWEDDEEWDAGEAGDAGEGGDAAEARGEGGP